MRGSKAESATRTISIIVRSVERESEPINDMEQQYVMNAVFALAWWNVMRKMMDGTDNVNISAKELLEDTE